MGIVRVYVSHGLRQWRLHLGDAFSGVIAAVITYLVELAVGAPDASLALAVGLFVALGVTLLRGVYHLWIAPAEVAAEGQRYIERAYENLLEKRLREPAVRDELQRMKEEMDEIKRRLPPIPMEETQVTRIIIPGDSDFPVRP